MTASIAAQRHPSRVRARVARAGCLLIALAACAALAGCCHHDAALVQKLTAAKATLVGDGATPGLYDRFTEPAIPAAEVQAARDQVKDVVDTAVKNQGAFCQEPAKQAKQIRSMFESHVKAREQGGAWSETIRDNRKENIGEAFDIAIETQNKLK
jgi:hypothetical protein